jgi:hypothetical protein
MTKPAAPDRAERRRQALASLAIEGMHATAEQTALFAEFDALGLSDEERRRRLAERARQRAAAPLVPVE